MDYLKERERMTDRLGLREYNHNVINPDDPRPMVILPAGTKSPDAVSELIKHYTSASESQAEDGLRCRVDDAHVSQPSSAVNTPATVSAAWDTQTISYSTRPTTN